MNKKEIQTKLVEYLKSNNLFDKDENFLVNKASMELDIKKNDIKSAVAFLVSERVLESKNGKLYLGDNIDKRQISKDILPQDIKDTIVAVIRQNQQGRLVAYPIDGSKPCEIHQDKISAMYENKLCLLHLSSNGNKRFGVIKNVIGDESEFEAQVKAILFDNHIRFGFDEDAKNQSKQIQQADITEDIKTRSDWRKLPLIAVDPIGCEDRDDAICVQKTNNGYRLYVAITDITHYVNIGSPLWKEAYIRATSHYNPLFSVPMFPHDVTNSIFSLDEGQDRLVLGCVIDFDKDGNQLSYHFEKAVAKIHHAMSYETFEKIHNGDGSLTKFDGEKQLVDDCYELANILNRKMNLHNKINAEIDEPNFVKSTDGKDIVDVKNDDKSFSHKVIEMFMIEANRSAGKFFVDNNVDGIYRVHQKISDERFVELKQILEKYGINYQLENTSQSVSNLIEHIKTLPYSQFVQGAILSKFFRAQYSFQRDIHFGMGFSANEPYTHFTSPARRFSDIIAHQIIKEVLENKKISFNEYNIESACMHINDQTTKADKVERKINNFAYCYLANKNIGKVYDCTVCRFVDDGVVVKDKNSPMTFVVDYCDLKNSNDEQFKFGQNQLCITNGVETYSLGDQIKCQITKVDFEDKKIYASTNLEKIEESVL